jgi:hypothetical protein
MTTSMSIHEWLQQENMWLREQLDRPTNAPPTTHREAAHWPPENNFLRAALGRRHQPELDRDTPRPCDGNTGSRKRHRDDAVRAAIAPRRALSASPRTMTRQRGMDEAATIRQDASMQQVLNENKHCSPLQSRPRSIVSPSSALAQLRPECTRLKIAPILAWHYVRFDRSGSPSLFYSFLEC